MTVVRRLGIFNQSRRCVLTSMHSVSPSAKCRTSYASQDVLIFLLSALMLNKVKFRLEMNVDKKQEVLFEGFK